MTRRRGWWPAVVLALAAVSSGCGEDGEDAVVVDARPGVEECDPDGELVDLDGRTVTIAVENGYLPFNYIDPASGEPAGWDYDAVARMAELLDFEPEFETFAWEPMIQAVADGQFDMAADGITITDRRAEVVDVSIGYATVEQRLLVRRGEDRISGADDLTRDRSLVLGGQTGTTDLETAVELVGESRVREFEHFERAVEALVDGAVDAVIVDEIADQGYVGIHADEVELVGGPLSSDELGFIFPKGSDLVCPIDQAIAAMAADGTLEELAERYFSDAFTVDYDDIVDPGTLEDAGG